MSCVCVSSFVCVFCFLFSLVLVKTISAFRCVCIYSSKRREWGICKAKWKPRFWNFRQILKRNEHFCRIIVKYISHGTCVYVIYSMHSYCASSIPKRFPSSPSHTNATVVRCLSKVGFSSTRCVYSVLGQTTIFDFDFELFRSFVLFNRINQLFWNFISM